MEYVIVIAVILLGLAGGAFYAYTRVRRVTDRLASAMGAKSILDGLEQIQKDNSERPKSLNGMNDIYLPRIERDFPDFNLDQFIQKANSDLIKTLNAIESQDVDSLKGIVSVSFFEKAKNIVDDLKSQNIVQKYDDIRIHKTVLSRYRKEPGHCLITLQSSVEFFDYRMRDEKVIDGSNSLKSQVRYEVDMINIQDLNKIQLHSSTYTEGAFGMHCPNCGAPVSMLGVKHCEYCGSPLMEIQIHSWHFSDFRRS